MLQKRLCVLWLEILFKYEALAMRNQTTVNLPHSTLFSSLMHFFLYFPIQMFILIPTVNIANNVKQNYIKMLEITTVNCKIICDTCISRVINPILTQLFIEKRITARMNLQYNLFIILLLGSKAEIIFVNCDVSNQKCKAEIQKWSYVIILYIIYTLFLYP